MRKRFAIAVTAAAFLGWQVSATPEGPAEFISTVEWQSNESWFGGFSGLEISEDGAGFVAISDRGQIVTGQLSRQNGKIDQITLAESHPVRGLKGQTQYNYKGDTEGLAIREDGRLFVSYEGNHRVWAYMSVGAKAAGLPRHPDFRKMNNNGSLEALAVDAQNRLYTFPEDVSILSERIPVYRYTRGVWEQPFDLPKQGSYKIVGADIGPDGKLYLLERNFTGWGFRSRVRRFDLSDTGLGPSETLLQSTTGFHDNLEGLSVWKDSEGHLRLTMISDDNFKFFQRTEFVEYRLTDQI